MSLLELFCHVDDFCQQTVSQWNSQRLSDSAARRDLKHKLTG